MTTMTTAKPDLVQVQITVNITFDAKGENHEWLRANAHRAISSEFSNGGITGSSDAVVDVHEIDTKLLSPGAAALDENAVTKWLSSQIEDGHMDLERLPLLMARYALADPAAMREELAERMNGVGDDESELDNTGKSDSSDERYLSDEGWTHCFVGSTESATRWTIDRHLSTLVHAQIYSGSKWIDMSFDEAKDLAEGLATNDVLAEFSNFECSGTLPSWVLATGATLRAIPVGDSVVDKDLTGPRIMARFLAQKWVNGYLVEIDDAHFEQDVTAKVLALNAAEIAEISDADYSTDYLIDHDHDGPFRVEVYEAICDYFDVNRLRDVTDELVKDARAVAYGQVSDDDEESSAPAPVQA